MAMSSGRKLLLVIGGLLLIFVLVVTIAGLMIYSSLRGKTPTVRDNSVLVLKVEGNLPDYAPEGDTIRKVLGQEQASFSSLLWQLKKAKADKRIGGVILEMDISGLGWGKADELRAAITDFRASGKPIYAYLPLGMNKEYYIAVACDKIFTPPTGDLFIQGLAAEAMFLRGSLDKVGVEPVFFQIGKYKSAPEMYTRKDMSDGQREVINALLDDFYNRQINAIAEARKKSSDEVRALIDGAPYTAQESLEKHLVDGLLYRDELDREMKKRLGYKDADSLNSIKGETYKQITPESLGLNEGERIAVIYGMGAIGGGSSGDDSIGSETMVKAVMDAGDDASIKAIVLRVDSPGGSSYASDEIWRAVEVAKTKKPVVISMADVAASGGYYIACNANKIIAEPSTITGSIGIFAGKPVLKEFYKWVGMNVEYTTRGKNAGLFREDTTFTPDERARFEYLISQTYYSEFVPKVAQGRGKDPEYINSIGQGRVWTGAQAKDKGLVDDFGGLDKAIEVAKELAKIPADRGVKRVLFPQPRTILDSFLGGDSEEALAQIRAQRATAEREAVFRNLPEKARVLARYAGLFERMQNGETMLLMPFELRIK